MQTNYAQLYEQTRKESEFHCPECGQFMPYNHDAITTHYTQSHVAKVMPSLDIVQRLFELVGKHGRLRKESQTPTIEAIAPSAIESDPDLSQFMSLETIQRIRYLASSTGAKLYKFKTLEQGVTDVYNRGHGRRTFSNDEKLRAARTLIGKDIDLNHIMFMHSVNFVVDAEALTGQSGNRVVVGLLYVEDEMINALYELGLVVGVSVEFFSRIEACSCQEPTNCTCDQLGINFVGIAIVTVPYETGDPAPELIRVEMLRKIETLLRPHAILVETSSRVNAKVELQAVIKTEVCGCKLKAEAGAHHSDQRASEQSSLVDGISHNQADEAAQPDHSSSKGELNEMNTEEITKLVQTETAKAVAPLTESINGMKSLIESLKPKAESEKTGASANNESNDAKLATIAGKAAAEAIAPFKTELVQLTELVGKLKSEMVTGNGTQNAGGNAQAPSKEELAPFYRAKLEVTSLADVVSFDAERKGMTVDAYVQQKQTKN